MKPLSQQTLIEAQIGFTIGILVGALGSWVYLMFFTNFEWYFKVLTCIGEIGIVGSILLSLKELIKGRRIYLDTLEEMEKIKIESEKVINDQTLTNLVIKKAIADSEKYDELKLNENKEVKQND